MFIPRSVPVKGTGAFARLLQPLASRKVRVALATVGSAFAARYGLNVDESLIATILATGASVILGIAHEDHGRFAAGANGGNTVVPASSTKP